MRNRLALLLLMGPVSGVAGQFAPPVAVGPTAAVELRAVDCDADEHLDLVGLQPGEGILWFRNGDGSGTFQAPLPVSTTASEGSIWAMADLTGDGAPEVVFTADGGLGLYYATNDGNGAFGTPILLWDFSGPEAYSLTAMTLAECTGDGLRDIVVSVNSDVNGASIRLSPNIGTGFGPFSPVGPAVNGPAPSFLLHGDIDVTGGNDLLFQDWNSNVLVLRNTNGDGSIWISDTISAGDWEYGLVQPQLLDVDGDGDLDLAQCGFPNVFWKENPLLEGGVMPDWVAHQLEPWTTAGPGAFGHLGCGTGAGYVCVPMNPSELPRYAHWLEPISDFSFSQVSADLLAGSGCLLADFDGDNRDDLVMNLNGEWLYLRNSTSPPLNPPVLPELPALCKWGPEFTLPDPQPSGGQWVGPGVFQNQLLRTSLSGQGAFQLGYAVFDTSGCPSAETASIQVYEYPLVSPFIGGEYCQNEAPIQLTAAPPDVTWFGIGPDGIFDPSTFQGNAVIAQYTDATGSSCVAESSPISIQWPVPVSIDPAGPFCINSGQQLITGNAPSPDFFWTGDIESWNSSGAVFLPSQGAGTYTIVLQGNPGTPTQCAGTDTLVIVVNEEFPTVSVSEVPILCATSAPIDLTSYATPIGGTWAGPGISANAFDPQLVAAGAYVLTYTVEQGGCLASQAAAVKVMSEAQIVPGTSEEICLYDAPLQFAAFPAGGVWSAPWSDEGVFDPGAVVPGTYALNYSWTGADGCELQSPVIELSVLQTTTVTMDAVGVLCDTGPEVLIMGAPSGTWSGAAEGEGESVVVCPATLGAGSWPITLTAAAPGECPGSVTEVLVVEICTGTEDLNQLDARAWPNPFDHAIDLYVGATDVESVELLDATGRVVVRFGPQAGGSRMLLGTTALPGGTYLVRVLRRNAAPAILRLDKL